MKKITITLVALAFAATGISAAISPAEAECRKKTTDAFKATHASLSKAQAECKTKGSAMERSTCSAGVVKSLKEATAKRDADLKACKPAKK